MRTSMILMLVVLGHGCGFSAGNAGPCTGSSDAPYPPESRQPTNTQLSTFDEKADEFRQAHSGSGGDFYRIQHNLATVSPKVSSKSADEDRGIKLGGGGLDRVSAESALSDFFAQWSGFFDPYDATLSRSATCDDRYCYLTYQQEICGMEVHQTEDHIYDGTIDITAFRSTGALMNIHSNVVPDDVIFPPVRLKKDGVERVLDGESFDTTCKGSVTLGKGSCYRSVEGPYVFIRGASRHPGIESKTVEYRLAYDVEVEPNCDGNRQIVTVDAVDETVLDRREVLGCDA